MSADTVSREEGPLLFSLESGRDFATAVARQLRISLAPSEERLFEDGEFKIRSLTEVRNRQTVLLQSLCAQGGLSVNDVLLRALFMLGALRDAGAARVHLVSPYFCYARKDRRTKALDPLSLRYVAQLLEAVGLDSITVVEVHNPAAFENAFRIPTIHLTANELFADYLAPFLEDGDIAVATPDIGGARRADALRALLASRLERPPGNALVYKHRSEGVVSGDLAAGDIEGRLVVVIDDMIVGGTTVQRAAMALRRAGARRILIAAVHGLFDGAAVTRLSDSAIDGIVVTNSVPGRPAVAAALGQRFKTLDLTPLAAAAILGLTGA